MCTFEDNYFSLLRFGETGLLNSNIKLDWMNKATVSNLSSLSSSLSLLCFFLCFLSMFLPSHVFLIPFLLAFITRKCCLFPMNRMLVMWQETSMASVHSRNTTASFTSFPVDFQQICLHSHGKSQVPFIYLLIFYNNNINDTQLLYSANYESLSASKLGDHYPGFSCAAITAL